MGESIAGFPGCGGPQESDYPAAVPVTFQGVGSWAAACVGAGEGRLWVAPSPSRITSPSHSPTTPPPAPHPHSYMRLRPRLLTHGGSRSHASARPYRCLPPSHPPPAAREPQSPPPPPLPLSLRRRRHCRRHRHRHRLSLQPRGEALPGPSPLWPVPGPCAPA